MAMPFHTTAQRLWKSLGPDERRSAATQFWTEPPAEVLGAALGALVKARHMRPQAARSLGPDAQARILATVLEPGETLAAALLVSLHLGERRPLLVAFLDALGLPHADGLLREETEPPPLREEDARKAASALGGFPRPHVATYFNTLWLQDPERWRVLETVSEAI
jgi:hypothetical protein